MAIYGTVRFFSSSGGERRRREAAALREQDNEERESNYILFWMRYLFPSPSERRFIFNTFLFFRFAGASVCCSFPVSIHTRTPSSCCFYINMTYHTMLSHYWSMLSRQMCIDSLFISLASLPSNPIHLEFRESSIERKR